MSRRSWWVTASHRGLERRAGEILEIPYGTSHLRRAGGPYTACGLPALNWPIFWDVEPSDSQPTCTECRAAS